MFCNKVCLNFMSKMYIYTIKFYEYLNCVEKLSEFWLGKIQRLVWRSETRTLFKAVSLKLRTHTLLPVSLLLETFDKCIFCTGVQHGYLVLHIFLRLKLCKQYFQLGE